MLIISSLSTCLEVTCFHVSHSTYHLLFLSPSHKSFTPSLLPQQQYTVMYLPEATHDATCWREHTWGLPRHCPQGQLRLLGKRKLNRGLREELCQAMTEHSGSPGGEMLGPWRGREGGEKYEYQGFGEQCPLSGGTWDRKLGNSTNPKWLEPKGRTFHSKIKKKFITVDK